ncbi:TetR/AcrR family transcriptional regulator [Streptomyces sp. NPDC003327]
MAETTKGTGNGAATGRTGTAATTGLPGATGVTATGRAGGAPAAATGRAAVDADGRSTRWNAHKARRQSELIDAAVAAIEDEGPGVGVKQIADRLGLPRSVVYRHFKDRADLDELIRRRIVDSLMADLAPTLEPDGTVIEAIRRSVDAYLDWIGRHPRLHAFLGTGAAAPGDGGGVVAGTKAAIAVRVGETFSTVLKALGADAVPAPAIAVGIVGFVDATVNHWLADRHPDLAPGLTPALTGERLADLLTCSIWSILDGNLRALGIVLSPDRPMSELL